MLVVVAEWGSTSTGTETEVSGDPLVEALRRAVAIMRAHIQSLELTIEACKGEYPDGAAYRQAEIDDLEVAIAVLERA